MPLESSITKSILEYLNSLPQCRAEKVQGSSSASGRADINACYKGHTLRIEVKTPDHKNNVSPKQIHNLNKWKKAGAITMLTYSKEAVEKTIELIDQNTFGINYYFDEKNGCMSWANLPYLQ